MEQALCKTKIASSSPPFFFYCSTSGSRMEQLVPSPFWNEHTLYPWICVSGAVTSFFL